MMSRFDVDGISVFDHGILTPETKIFIQVDLLRYFPEVDEWPVPVTSTAFNYYQDYSASVGGQVSNTSSQDVLPGRLLLTGITISLIQLSIQLWWPYTADYSCTHTAPRTHRTRLYHFHVFDSPTVHCAAQTDSPL